MLCIPYYFPFLVFYYTIYFRKLHYFFAVFHLFLYNNLAIFLYKMTFYIFLFNISIFRNVFCVMMGNKFPFYSIFYSIIQSYITKKEERYFLSLYVLLIFWIVYVLSYKYFIILPFQILVLQINSFFLLSKTQCIVLCRLRRKK